MQKFIIPKIKTIPCRSAIHGQDARHIIKVLRLGKGDILSLTDGCGMDFTAKILQGTARQIELEIFESTRSAAESPVRLTLCSGMLKNRKMDMVVKHATQLGMNQWIPFFCDRSVPGPDDRRLEKRIERWQALAKESLKQCRRSTVPDIAPPCSFQQALSRTRDDDLKIAFWEKADTGFDRLIPSEKVNRITLLIGPEGGFSPAEISLARADGFRACSLGPRILRAETAAISGCTLIQHLFGDI